MTTRARAPRRNKTALLQKRVETALTQLLRGELVKPSFESGSQEAAYLFRHALVQDTALSTLLRGEYKRLNLLVARALERVNATRLDEYAAQLAQHFAAGEDDTKTLTYAAQAGNRAMRVYANPEAAAFFTQALEAAARLNAPTKEQTFLFLQRGRAYELNAQYDAALANYDEMERAGQDHGDRSLELAALMARLPIFATPTPKHDPSKAEMLANQALTLAREIGDRAAEAKTLWLKMLTMVRSMRPQDGIADGEAALALARELNLPEQLAFTMHDLAGAYSGVGQFDRAEALILQARELWRQLDNKPMLADNLSSHANGLIFVGKLDEVIALSEEAFHISQSIGNLWGQAYSLAMVGQAHAERGDYALALKKMQDCIRYAEQAGFFVPQVQTRAGLAQAYFQIGAVAQARQVAEQALILSASQSAMVHPLASSLSSRFYLILGEEEKAQAALIQARDAIRRDALPDFMQLLITSAELELGLARGEYTRVLELTGSLFQVLRAMRLRFYLPEVLYKRAQALLERHDRDAAWGALVEADRYAQQIGSRRMRWQILARMNEIEFARGNLTAAADLRAGAQTIIEYIVAHMPDEFRESFLNLPHVSAVMEHNQ